MVRGRASPAAVARHAREAFAKLGDDERARVGGQLDRVVLVLHHVFGAGIKYDFGGARVDTTFTRSLGRTRIRYGYNTAALGINLTWPLGFAAFGLLTAASPMMAARSGVPAPE